MLIAIEIQVLTLEGISECSSKNLGSSLKLLRPICAIPVKNLEVDTLETVGSIKSELRARDHGVWIEGTQLLWKGKALDNEKTLKDQGVSGGFMQLVRSK